MIWDRKTGKAAHNAIVWQDRRTADRCAELKAAGKEARVRELTGLTLDPYFSGTKVSWMLHNVDGMAAAARDGRLAFGTIDSYLLWRLTGGAVHATDVTNASRTLLFDHQHADVERRAARAARRAARAAAERRAVVGRGRHDARASPGLPDGIPIAGIAGDQQSALFGQACFTPGDAKCTYGTGAFILMNTGDKPVASKLGPAHHRRVEAASTRRRAALRARRLGVHRRRRGAVAARRPRLLQDAPSEIEALAR